MAPQVRIIVVNFNSGDYLRRCLEALKNQTFRDFEAVIADNGSTDGSLDAAMPVDPRFRAFRLGANLGFAAANNRGAEDASAPWIATLNPDAFPEPGWLAALMRATERHPGIVMFGSTQLDYIDPRRLDGTGDAYFAFGVPWRGGYGRIVSEVPSEGETFSPCAASALYNAAAVRAIGGFDERFFCYIEDVDLGFRLRLVGGGCIQVSDAVVRHVGSAITGSSSAFAVYHCTRNQLWTFVKNMPPPLFWLLLPGYIVLQTGILLRAAQRGQPKPVWRGLVDGVCALRPILRERRKIQSCRTVSWIHIAKALTWSPVKLLFRRHDVRPVA